MEIIYAEGFDNLQTSDDPSLVRQWAYRRGFTDVGLGSAEPNTVLSAGFTFGTDTRALEVRVQADYANSGLLSPDFDISQDGRYVLSMLTSCPTFEASGTIGAAALTPYLIFSVNGTPVLSHHTRPNPAVIGKVEVVANATAIGMNDIGSPNPAFLPPGVEPEEAVYDFDNVPLFIAVVIEVSAGVVISSELYYTRAPQSGFLNEAMTPFLTGFADALPASVLKFQATGNEYDDGLQYFEQAAQVDHLVFAKTEALGKPPILQVYGTQHFQNNAIGASLYNTPSNDLNTAYRLPADLSGVQYPAVNDQFESLTSAPSFSQGNGSFENNPTILGMVVTGDASSPSEVGGTVNVALADFGASTPVSLGGLSPVDANNVSFDYVTSLHPITGEQITVNDVSNMVFRSERTA